MDFLHKSRSQLQKWRFLIILFGNIYYDVTLLHKLCKNCSSLHEEKCMSNNSPKKLFLRPKLPRCSKLPSSTVPYRYRNNWDYE